MKRYQIIYADPPWQYSTGKVGERCWGPEAHYPTMATEDICKIPVKDIADDNAILFLWATFPKLWEAKPVIESWGFEFKTVAFVWVKVNKRTDPDQLFMGAYETFYYDDFYGMGMWTRSNAEICLLATRGNLKRQSTKVKQLIYEPIGRHSEKPALVRDRIVELCGDLPRVELFARKTAAGWDAWGNEVECDVELSVPLKENDNVEVRPAD